MSHQGSIRGIGPAGLATKALLLEAAAVATTPEALDYIRTQADEALQGDAAAEVYDAPWHVGFCNEIADRLQDGLWQPEMVRYRVVNICDSNGRHVAWACSLAHAEMIISAVNSAVCGKEPHDEHPAPAGAEKPA